MRANSLSLLLLSLIFSAFHTPFLQLEAADDKRSYVVYLGQHWGVEKGASKLDAHSITDSHYQLLGSFLGSKEKAREAIFYSYTNHINGFAAILDNQEVAAVSEHPQVVSIFENEKRDLDRSGSSESLGLERSNDEILEDSTWRKANFGEDVIIGNLDTGVWPELESFNDQGIAPVPFKWKGLCDADSGIQCNRKLIGARYFNKGFEAVVGSLNSSQLTPRDTDGHGTHMLSNAAGRFAATPFGSSPGIANSGAPLARLAAYKVCWLDGCFDADILAAFDAAIHDGVDVLSISIGAPSFDYFSNSIAIGSFHAIQNGILVVSSAGNDGPNPNTVTNMAPWMLTVEATNIDRDFPSYVVLGNNERFMGSSYITNTLPTKTFYPLIHSADAKAANASIEQALRCAFGSLDPTQVSGKIVCCHRGGFSRIYKGFVVAQAGGIGMILYNKKTTENISPRSHIIPTSQVSASDGLAILSYINDSKSPEAYIIGATELGIKLAPVVPFFSSVGPNKVTQEILKPDIAASGMSILAAYSKALGRGPSFLPSYEHRVTFSFDFGTSASCSYVLGIAALLKAIHPSWSPAIIRSAIMTTAKTRANMRELTVNESLAVENPSSYRAGLIRPNHAVNPGLVYDVSTLDYLNFLCAIGYDATKLSRFANENNKPYECPLNAPTIMDLNYPSMIVPNLFGKIKMYRTVTNVGASGSTIYVARIQEPVGILVRVEPEWLKFEKVNEKKTFTVTLERKEKEDEDDDGGNCYKFGMVIWSNGAHVVRSPLVVGLSNKEGLK
ncbi:subtilisin-like protease SBT5.3 [Malania oleifera]|uniref:subtilisin-like protease SBT5.3 n=1 Tax=Malania oleifera TaxID=397392 RepID=UPI0025AE68F2|nr:subtilisin-like protease SBT5.3 [Malania oleifera]